MASQVPYTGTQEVSPQLEPTPQAHVDTPIAAFGGAVAGAVTHMGEVAEGAGKELFSRAYAMQELDEQAKANAALSGYQNDLTDKYVDYNKLKGQDAISGFDGFAKGTEDLRTQYSDKMTSPYGKFLFDQESRNARFRVVFGAGNYARGEMNRFEVESGDLKLKATGNLLAAATPGDPAATQQAIDRAKVEADYQASRASLVQGTDEYNEFVRQQLSKVTTPSIREIMKKDPQQAQTLLQDWYKKGWVTDTDVANLGPMIKGAIDTRAARGTGNMVNNGELGWDWDSKTVAPNRLIDALTKAGPGDYNMVGPEDPSGNGHTVGKYGVPSSELPLWLKDAGMGAMTEQQFLADPKAQDQLAQFKAKALQDQYGNVDEVLKTWSSGINTDARLKTAHKALAEGASRSELMDTAEKAANKLQPNDEDFTEATKNHVIFSRERTDTYLAKDKFDNNNVVSDALLVGDQQSGKVPTSMPELLADPKVQDAYDKLEPKEKIAVTRALQRNINEGGFNLTPQTLAQFQRLHGIAVDPDSTVEERKELLNTDVTNLPMPIKERAQLQKERKQVYDGAFGNPPVSHALQVLQPLLSAYNLSKESDPDRYERFVGALHDSLQGQAEGQVKQPNDDQIKQIGMMLLRDKPGSGFFGTNLNKKQWFEQPGDTKATGMAIQALTKQLGRPPSDSEVGNFLLRKQFQILGGKAQPAGGQ